MTLVSAERMATIFVEVADTLVDDFDLMDFLHMLTDRAADLVSAAAVGLVLAGRDGRLEFMAGSNENVKLVELFQLQTHEGPCQEAFRTGVPVINVDLSKARAPVRAPGHRSGFPIGARVPATAAHAGDRGLERLR